MASTTRPRSSHPWPPWATTGDIDKAGHGLSVFQAVALAINRPLIERIGRFVEASMILGIGCTYRQHLIDERI
jgi:hypothetical protein